MNIEEIKSISIISYLKSIGFQPKNQSGNRFFFTSPFNPIEKTPSFTVRPKENVFACYSSGFKGDIIEFVKRYHQLNFLDAVEKLKQFDPSLFSFIWKEEERKTIEIREINTIRQKSLYWYISKRKIDIHIAKKYLKEVHYKVGESIFFSIGFQNDKGGWELSRWHENPKKRKRAISPKGITTIRGNKNNQVLLFEGFFDYLSYLTLKNIQEPEFDSIILNSVSLVDCVFDLIGNYQKIFCVFDNDEAGKNTFEKIRKLYPKAIDMSVKYRNHKDLNDYLCQ